MKTNLFLGWLLAATLVSGAVSAAAETSAALEALEQSTAFSQVSKSRGVVFVDLYAEW